MRAIHEEQRRAREQKPFDYAAISHAILPFDLSFDSNGMWIYPAARRLWRSVRARVSMISFDGFRFAYLIGRGPAEGTTKLSKPNLKLLSGRQRRKRGFPGAGRLASLPAKCQT
jgi:hypothetical protein